MDEIDRSQPVIVTGATGYIAGWIIKGLLDAGVTVHATVRDPGATARLKHLEDAAAASDGVLRFFQSDLLDPGSFDAAMNGAAIVIHTASPFKLEVKDPQADLVDPAVKGTRAVLEAATRATSVKRVVLTSSVVAIYGDAADVANAPGGVLDESVWNASSSLEHMPYNYSKTRAERAAWELADAQGFWDLVTINPSMVIGPALNPPGASESFSIVKQIGDGTLRMGAPDLNIGVVDVRDVAQAHLAAAFLPKARGRYIVSSEDTSNHSKAEALRSSFSAYPLPKRQTPKWLIWLIGPFISRAMTRQYVSRNIGFPFAADNSKSVRELGLSYRPMALSLAEMFQQMIDVGTLKDRRSAR